MNQLLISLTAVFALALVSSPKTAASQTPCWVLKDIQKNRVGDFVIGWDDDGQINSVTNSVTKQSCNLQTERVMELKRLGNSTDIFIESGGPSNVYVTIYDPRNCTRLLEIETFNYKFVDKKLKAQPYCDCESIDAVRCHCFSGHVYAFDAKCRPKELPRESAELTKSVIGVGFGEECWVYKPKTKTAKIIEAEAEKAAPAGKNSVWTAGELAEPSQGVYMESGYKDILNKTKSPLAAFRKTLAEGVPQSIRLDKINGDLKLSINYNYHEEQSVILKPKGVAEWRGESGGRSIHFTSKNRFQLKGEKSTLNYVRLDAGAFLISLLEGEYRDAQGRSYKFTSDGKAVLPKENFSFAVGVDQIFDDYDYIEEKGADRRIAFRWEGATLGLYPVKKTPDGEGAGYGFPDYDHPIAKLVHK